MIAPGLTSAPPPVPIPEPDPLIEAGVTTSEWKALLGYAAQALLVGTGTVAAKLGWHLSSDTMNMIVNLELGLAAATVSYVISRGIRKAGIGG